MTNVQGKLKHAKILNWHILETKKPLAASATSETKAVATVERLKIPVQGMFQVKVNLFVVKKYQELNFITKTTPWGCKGATKRRANSSNCKTRNIMYTGQVLRGATPLFCGHLKWNEKVVRTWRKLCLTYSWNKKTVDGIRDKQNKSPVETVERLKIPVQVTFKFK